MDWAYVAGFFDGEGSLRIRHRNSVTISFTNTNIQVLEAIRDFIGCGRIHGKQKTLKPHWLPRYQLDVEHHRDVLRVAKQMLPHAIIKAKALRGMVNFIEGRRWMNTPHRNQLKDLTPNRLQEYMGEGMTQREIASKYGVTQSAVWKRVRKVDMVWPRHKLDQASFFTSNV